MQEPVSLASSSADSAGHVKEKAVGEAAAPRTLVAETDPSTNDSPVPPKHFHPKRDLLSRRQWRERIRRVVRVGVLLVGDAVSVATAIYASDRLITPEVTAWPELVPLAVVFMVAIQALFGTFGPNRDRRHYLRAFGGGVLSSAGVAGLSAFYAFPTFSPFGYALYGALAGLLAIAVRGAAEAGVRTIYRHGWNRKPTLVLGRTEDVWEILERLRQSEERRARVVGHLSPRAEQDPVAMGGLEELASVLESHDVESVIISAHLEPERLEGLILECFSHGVPVSVVPRTLSRIPSRVSSHDVLGWPLVELEPPRLHFVQVVLKRTVDLVGAFVGLLLFAPVGILVAAAVKLDSPGPIFFRQRRLGVGGRPFTIYKFRTMRQDSEELLRRDPRLYRKYRENDFKLPPEEDPRITKLGRFLRRTSLDEFPQLWNVLKGDMSLVGPRPIVPEEIQHYGEQAALFLGVRPGITGHWQVNGRSDVTYPERAELDIRYIKQWSVGKDLRILFRTIPAVLGTHGAH